MEELIKLVTGKLGISADKARTAIEAALGFLRGKLPAEATSQLDSSLKSLGLTGPLPEAVDDEAAVAAKAGIETSQVPPLLETVLTFLKAKLPAGGLSRPGGRPTKPYSRMFGDCTCAADCMSEMSMCLAPLPFTLPQSAMLAA